jgi:RND family efflux transporter MFP subunit
LFKYLKGENTQVEMKSKITKIAAIVLTICGAVFLLTGCIGQSNSNAAASLQTTTVQISGISIVVTGTGNLALENKQELSFGQTGLVSQAANAKVSDVLVTEGQTVDAGEVLVKADPQGWQDQVITDQHNLDAKKVALVQSQTAVVKAQSALAGVQNALVNAQTTLSNAQYNLSVQQDVKAAQDKIDTDNNQLQFDQTMLKQAFQPTSGLDPQFWQTQIANDKAQLVYDQKVLNDILNDPASKGVSVTDINTKVAAVNQAQAGITLAQANVDQAQADITQAQANVIIAQNAVEDAQRTIDEDQSSSQTITAPFKGLITQVNVKVGDIVSRSANLIEIADPAKFEANIMVTERDVASLKIGMPASVSFDALIGQSNPAKIIKINPLATVQQGVVNYKVTVELTSAQAPDSSTLNDLQTKLKDGFSAVVTIPVQTKENILIVPSQAVSHQGQDYTVQVIKGSATETRVVKVGITDYQNIEIIEGLNQGDKVVLPVIPTAAPSSSGGLFGGG